MPINLDDLNEQQRAAVVHDSGPLLILAGAGTGKTRVITYRIARLIENGAPPDRILAVTFTNKAAGEMRHRLEALSPGRGALVWAHTFHAFAVRLLRRHHERLGLGRHFTIYDQDDQKREIVQAMKDLGLEDQKNKAGLYASLISRAKDDLLDAGSYSIYTMASPEPSRQIAARIYTVYQKRLVQSGALDFGDLLLKTCELLRDHKDIREQLQEQFIHLLVDEYQDTNHAQYTLTKTLAAKHRNLCVVGDDDQSVYSWRGANIRNILEFERDFADTKVVTLEQNYRSTPQVLAAATSVIRNNKSRKLKTLWTQQGAGTGVEAKELVNEAEEARWVTGRILAMMQSGGRAGDAAIFYRTNAQSRSFEEALRAARVPHIVVGAMRFYERKEVKDALAYARLIVNPDDGAALARVYNTPTRGIGKVAHDALMRHAQEKGLTLLGAFRDSAEVQGLAPGARRAAREFAEIIDFLRLELQSSPPSAALRRVLEASRYMEVLESELDTDPEAAGRIANIQELLNAVREYEDRASRGGEIVDLARYLEDVALQSDLDSLPEGASVVTLMTVHLAKGLEFPVVFLTGLEEGLFPIGSGHASPGDLEEERRLCYVGMTRARQRLYLSYAATRRLFGHVYANLPSRFVLEAQLGEGRETPQRASLIGAPASRPEPSAPRESPAVRASVNGLAVGMRVRHPDFGVGRVLDKSGSGETVKVTVRFDNGRTAKLLVRYAPLEPA